LGRQASHHISCQSIGLAGGDDSLTPNLEDKYLVSAGKAMGFTIKPKNFPRHSPGVNFLARVYSPDVWTGCPDSMCDFQRQIVKLHLTTRMDPKLPLPTIAVDKMRGYVLTDTNTPIIGAFANLIVSVFDPEFLTTYTSNGADTTDTQYFSKFQQSDQFPNEYGDWMVAEIERSCPGVDFQRFSNWIADVNVKSITDVLSPPLILDLSPPDVSSPVVINGELVRPVKFEKSNNKNARGRRRRGKGKQSSQANVTPAQV